jgi:putative SOS response-associated peptidase YedK
VAPIHDRQMVILERSDWKAWLDLTRPEAELLQPLPAGSLTVEQVRQVPRSRTPWRGDSSA